MKKWEAGVTNIQYPHEPRWTGDFIEAKNGSDAEALFAEKGYYRNLVVREVVEPDADVEKRIETYKKHFIRNAAKRFPNDLKNGLVDIPARFNTAEYKRAVRELLNQ